MEGWQSAGSHSSRSEYQGFQSCLAYFCLGLMMLGLTANPLQAQNTCEISCDELVGGDINDVRGSFSKIHFFTKAATLNRERYERDELSAYHRGGEAFFEGSTGNLAMSDFGVGVSANTSKNPRINDQINYIPQLGRSDRLLLDFGSCAEFTGADVVVSRFYSLENNRIGETGAYRALDENFQVVGSGVFEAITPFRREQDPGIARFQIRTSAPYRYIEFIATPANNTQANTTLRDNSDFFLQSIRPTCQPVPEAGRVIGGGQSFDNWVSLAVSVKDSDSEFFIQADPEIFVPGEDPNDLNSGGLGVPGDGNAEINYNPSTRETEGLRLAFGAKFNLVEFNVSELFEGEEGLWIAYDVVDGKLEEVARGTFQGQGDESQKVALTGLGQSTVSAQSSREYSCLEVTGSIQGSQGAKSDGELGFILSNVTPDPNCTGVSEVVSYFPGRTKEGRMVAPERQILDNVLGPPEDDDRPQPFNFVSLGFGGEITLKFFQPFANGPGPDVQIFETSFQELEAETCEDYPEQADVFASQDGRSFIYLGRACRDDASFDLGPLEWAQFIKIIDVSDPHDFDDRLPVVTDGYDVDGAICLNGSAVGLPAETELTVGTAAEVVAYEPGLRKDNQAIQGYRVQGENALGKPDALDSKPKFASLGLGDGSRNGVNASRGYMTVRFDYVIFDLPNANDFKVYETTYGNAPFRRYPEQAEFFVSQDGENWVSVGKSNSECEEGLDSEFDLAGKLPWAQYVKAVDITNPNAIIKDFRCNLNGRPAFNRVGDGFDIDAIVYLDAFKDKNQIVSADAPNTSRSEVESGPVHLYPNPSAGELHLDFSEEEEFVIPETGVINVKIYNFMGRLVKESNQELDMAFESHLELGDLPKGIYVVKINADGMERTVKFSKE